jgi:dipeptidyl aminopeptidase/acylaminoacyl peptidase
MRRLTLALAAALFLLPAARADKPAKPPAKTAGERWTVADVIESESATDFQVSPDGRLAVWVKTTADADKGEHVGQLVRTDLAGGREVVLTRGGDSCTHPRFSPDGKLLAFLSARPAPGAKSGEDKDKDKDQIWLLDPTGGEPWPLTESVRGVLHYAWAGPDALVFVAQEEPTLREATLKDEKDTTVVVEDERHEPPARLFRVAVESKKVTRLTDNPDRIEALAFSPDGRRAVTIHNRSLRYTFDNKVKPVVLLTDLEGGEPKQIFADPKLNISHVWWAPDGRGLYVSDEHNSRPQFNQAGVTELHYYDLAGGAAARIDLGWERGLAVQDANDAAVGFAVTADGFLALLADGVRNRAARFTRVGAGWKREWLTGAHADHFFGLQAAPDGKSLLYAHSTASSPPQWYHARLEGGRIEKPMALAKVNERLRQLTRACTEVVRWKGAQGDEVEGLLYYPHEYKAGTKYPLVVMIHGGPALADTDCWDDTWLSPVNLLCQRGAFVLRPNYHGSSSYGLKWLESITGGKYGDLETVDVEKGVDALIARGLVDRERLGLAGWSNGAVLTNRLLVETTRYKAASSGAGSVEYVSDWANCEFGDAFDRYYLGASPLEGPQLYLRKSPFYRLDRVRTPTLIFFGAEDRVVATGQGWVHYRGLQQLGKAPVRFVLFPGEKHLLTKLAHQRRKLEEELAWFDRYLFNPGRPAANEALKEASPLAWALKRKQARREGRSYGLLEKGVLAPETVKYGGLHVGRFEVTRAQYVQFDKTYEVEPGRENYPASGITFEQARGYCAWLSKATGRRYRLPTAAEADELYGPGEEGDNTLDAWAGYAVNPDDAARLRPKLAELGAGALLREVGSGRAAGDAAVFDLGGNVAEWVTAKDGRGLLRGGSADQPADARRRRSDAAPEYRGFRVVREEG